MKDVAFHNLGCKVNSYELDIMQEQMQKKGYRIVSFQDKADIYIVNTCTVTNMADRKSRQMLHRAKQQNPAALVVAVGCYVQTNQDKALQDDGIDLCIGNNRKNQIVEIIEEYLQRCGQDIDGQVKNTPERKTLENTTIVDIAQEKQYEEMQLGQSIEHTRAYIKIQDGCNQFCSYCAIPLARGRVRSRKREDIFAELRELIANGYQEVVLTGIHLSSYGIDFLGEQYHGESLLMDVIEDITALEGLKRLRIGSLEPRIITREAAERLAANDKICPHFHLSLQSGCDATLKRMNRQYTGEEFARSVQYLREAYGALGKQVAITTDVIVGFPGETEEEFEITRQFLDRIGFFEMHIFKYSRRENTRAAAMPNQIAEEVKTARSNVLLKMDEEKSKAYRGFYLGKEIQVLWEEVKEIGHVQYLLGHTPDYVKAALPIEESDLEEAQARVNTLQRVIAKDFLTEELLLVAEKFTED